MTVIPIPSDDHQSTEFSYQTGTDHLYEGMLCVFIGPDSGINDSTVKECREGSLYIGTTQRKVYMKGSSYFTEI